MAHQSKIERMQQQATTNTNPPLEQTVAGKLIYLLALVAMLQFGYPITAYGTTALVIYELLYVSMIVVGVIIARDSRRHVIFLAVTGSLYLAASLYYATHPTATWSVFITYAALIPFHLMLLWILARFLSTARTITRDVLFAATAIYLLLGAVFVPLYGVIESLAAGSFQDGNAPGAPVVWQQLVYFSYTTLTTAGYGDVLPVSWWARSLANVEMVVGVLYITIVMARLVSLYSAGRHAGA